MHAPQGGGELVRARLGDHVEHPAGGAPEFGQVAASDDVHLVDELGRQRGAADAVGGVVHRQAVDDVAVLGRGGAGHRRAVQIGAGLGGGLGDALERAHAATLGARPGDRHPLHHLVRDVGADRARPHVDRGRVAGQVDLLLLGGGRDQHAVDPQGGAGPQDDARLLEAGVILLVHPDHVRAGQQAGHPVKARAVGDHGLLALKRRRAHGDDGVGNGGLRVSRCHPPLDDRVAGLGLSGRDRAGIGRQGEREGPQIPGEDASRRVVHRRERLLVPQRGTNVGYTEPV